VASALAWFEVCHGWASWQPRSWSWWITLLNLVGSVAFGVSAVAGYISPATGQLRNAERANLGTLVGAVFFLAGALLLLPERTEAERTEAEHAEAERTEESNIPAPPVSPPEPKQRG
jgi:peptidoglycan/LPS O-acetylase OafA/YrhL